MQWEGPFAGILVDAFGEETMMNFRAAFAGLAVLAFVGPVRQSAEARGAVRVDWQTDIKSAFDQARKTGKPLWVLFR